MIPIEIKSVITKSNDVNKFNTNTHSIRIIFLLYSQNVQDDIDTILTHHTNNVVSHII